jgi:hypothetical protein
VARWYRVIHALKEARLQILVLTDRNCIRGQVWRVSKHTFAKPLTNKLYLVDAAGINGKISVIPGEVLSLKGAGSQQRS